MGKAPVEGPQGDCGLQPSQRGPQTVMQSPPEPEVIVGSPAEIDIGRALEHRRVPLGGQDDQLDSLTRFELLTAPAVGLAHLAHHALGRTGQS